MISATNLHQKLNSMADSESSFNSAFKTVPGCWIWERIKGVVKVSKLLSEIPKWLKKKQKKNVKWFLTYINTNLRGKWIHPSESWGSEDFKTGIAFKNWSNIKPITSKTRKVEKTQFLFSISVKAKKKRPLCWFLIGSSTANTVIFMQSATSGAVLNAELNQLSESGIEFKIWWIFQVNIIIQSNRINRIK